MRKTTANRSVRDMAADFLNVLWYLRERTWLVLTVAFLSGSTAYIATKSFAEPTYRAEFTAYVNNRNFSMDVISILSDSDIQASRSMADSYAEILTGSEMLLQAAEKAGLNGYTYEELLDMVSIRKKNDTEVIEISVIMDSPEKAVDFANTLADIAVGFAADIADGSSMKIIDSAVLPDTFYGPDYRRNAMMGMAAGAVLACGILILMYFLDDTIYSERELEKRLDVVILGSVRC